MCFSITKKPIGAIWVITVYKFCEFYKIILQNLNFTYLKKARFLDQISLVIILIDTYAVKSYVKTMVKIKLHSL